MRNDHPTALPPAARTAFAALPTAPGAARSFLRDTLRTWGLHDLVEAAELIVSELVTNAVKATGCPGPEQRRHVDLHDTALVEVDLQMTFHAFRIAVQDGSTKWPERQTLNEEAENGRGLFLVDALSSRWDVESLGSHGKVTWVELDIPMKEHP